MSAFPNSTPVLPDTGFLRQSQVLLFIPFSKSTLWRRIASGTFPAPVKLSEKITVWRAEDVRSWISQPTSGTAGRRAAPIKPSQDLAIGEVRSRPVAKRAAGSAVGTASLADVRADM